MAHSTLPVLPHQNFPQPLSRELALLNLVGVVQHAIGNLNLNDHPAALRTLLRGLEVYTLAESHTSKKENQSDGNRSAAA